MTGKAGLLFFLTFMGASPSCFPPGGGICSRENPAPELPERFSPGKVERQIWRTFFRRDYKGQRI